MEENQPRTFSLRLDADILDRVDTYAKRTRRSRNATLNYLLEVALNQTEATERDQGEQS